MVQMRQPYERPALKQDAKAAMAKKSPTIYLLSLLMLVINLLPTAVIQGPVYLNAFRTGSLDGLQESLVVRMQTSGAGVSLVTMLINLFLSIVAVGYCRYCLRVSREEETGGAEELFRCFPQFWRFFVLNLLTGLFVMLWSFLLIIPGIIAALSYSQATFLMLDNPELSALDAIRQSKALMRGHKGEYFTLCLSFFGWLLLSGLTLGILGIWRRTPRARRLVGPVSPRPSHKSKALRRSPQGSSAGVFCPGGLRRPQSRKSNRSLGWISSTSHSRKITSKDTPTLPSSMALIWLRSISASSASCSWVSFFRLR